MDVAGADTGPPGRILGSWLPYLLVLGLYLSLRGYHSLDGDQAYRLPLLLHQQDPRLFVNDPFVQSFDQFNPHRGSLALLDGISRLLGLSLGLFFVFALTLLGTCQAVLRLARATWIDRGNTVGWVAVALFLLAKAGNIGTNHLFEAMVLDRLVALALGWQAIAAAVIDPTTAWRGASPWIGLAAVVHPSVGLQLAMLLAASWLGWALLGRPTCVTVSAAVRGAASLGLAVLPGLWINLPNGSGPRGHLPESLFWLLSVELQNPQHMLPHLWRMPQWLSWISYLVLSGLSLARYGMVREPAFAMKSVDTDRESEPSAPRRRLAIMLAVVAIGLGAAWPAIEIAHHVPVTVSQPFRMSTVARGLALILISGRLVSLWKSGGVVGRTRATVLAIGFLGDWLLVVATIAELAVAKAEMMTTAFGRPSVPRLAPTLIGSAFLVLGIRFLAHHDTASGHWPLLLALVVGIVAGAGRGRIAILLTHLAEDSSRRSRRLGAAVCAAWVVPGLALAVSLIPPRHPMANRSIVRGLVERCRFLARPMDDIERLGLWCREHTPTSARFIGPPGPKTFRLWSRRNLAFNRSGSPYHGAGLSDWFARFQDHVDHHGTPEEFVRDYREHRHEFEARYDGLDDEQHAALAVRQGAEYVIARAPRASPSTEDAGPLELLHVEGRYAVYKVNRRRLSTASRSGVGG